MRKVNFGRVLTGALLWWLVVMVLGVPAWMFYGQEWQMAVAGISRFPIPNTEFVVVFNVGVFALGVVTMWLYASMRSFHGPGPKTAAMAGLAVWFCLSVADIFWAELRFMPRRLVGESIAVYLVAIVAATMAGAWQYRDAAGADSLRGGG